nr:hypothetical protein [Bacillota bacterium]
MVQVSWLGCNRIAIGVNGNTVRVHLRPDGRSNCKHHITSTKIEAFNATIARIVRRACGYRDLEYLHLKIRQEVIL